MYRDRCRLAWKPPLDDGGRPILRYVVEAQDVESQKWVKVGVAESNIYENLCYRRRTARRDVSVEILSTVAQEKGEVEQQTHSKSKYSSWNISVDRRVLLVYVFTF